MNGEIDFMVWEETNSACVIYNSCDGLCFSIKAQ